jgi:LmbE family N-acetylglucosaminyl deacetylase
MSETTQARPAPECPQSYTAVTAGQRFAVVADHTPVSPRRPPVAESGLCDHPGQRPGEEIRVAKTRRSGRRASEPSAPPRVMSIHAHPDDQEFTVAGTLAKWARTGSEIVTVCITSGGAGSNASTPPDMTRETLVPIREEEQKRACAVLGLREPIFLGYEDGMLEPSLALRRDLTRLIRRHCPDALVCGDPTVRFYWNRYMNHPDHRVAADVALDAAFPSAETRFIFPELLAEGLAPHKVKQVFLHGSERPDTFVDIADVLDMKLAALKEHRSQMGDWDPTGMITGWARQQGARRGLLAAEAFRLLRLDDS